MDIRVELRDTFERWYPGADSSDLLAPGWSDERWLTDPTWIEFKLVKSDIVRRAMGEAYRGIKGAARAAGKDPDTIYVGGNDIGKLNVGAETGTDQLDQVNIEYDPYFSAVTGSYSDHIPPYGQAATYYRHVQQYAGSQHAVVWYYLWALPVTAFQNDPALGELLAYEALANNTLLNFGADNNPNPGTSTTARAVNQTIERLAPVFGIREQYADIGLFFSPDTEYGDLTPGGYRDGGKLDHTLGYYGWGNALTRLSIPFRPVPEFRCTAQVLDGLRVLILPNVRALSEHTLRDVLGPWVDGGGAVIVTGADSGILDGLRARYRRRRSAALADLAERAATKGLGIYRPANLGMDFYLSSGRTTADLDELQSILDQLSERIGMAPAVTLDGVGPKVVANLHVARSGERVFVDLLNEDITLDDSTGTASITPTNGGSVVVRLPTRDRAPTSIQWWDADRDGPVTLHGDFRAGALALDLPAFRVYATAVLNY